MNEIYRVQFTNKSHQEKGICFGHTRLKLLKIKLKRLS